MHAQQAMGKYCTFDDYLTIKKGVDELDHESTVRLLSILIERNLFLFDEHHLRIVADYVNEKTGAETYWDVPSTYLGYSPLG